MKVMFWYLWSSCAIFRLGYSGISSDKCQEYAKAVYSIESSPVMSKTSVPNNVSTCGIVSTPLIVGGTAANSREFPHQALIGYAHSLEDRLLWGCGGSLISEDYVLTAAHCLLTEDLPCQLVRFGAVDFFDPEPDELQERKIREKIEHPKYDNKIKEYDIALLRLEHPVKFTAFVRPACLNTLSEIPQKKAIATGFGLLQHGTHLRSDTLMKVTLDIHDTSECVEALPKGLPLFQNGIPETILCVGDMAGGKDACSGDSGGPLQVILQEPYCMYSVIGVTSFGKSCGLEKMPAIYTKVEKFIPWIENLVWPEKQWNLMELIRDWIFRRRKPQENSSR